MGCVGGKLTYQPIELIVWIPNINISILCSYLKHHLRIESKEFPSR